jgi:hypothetical protein
MLRMRREKCSVFASILIVLTLRCVRWFESLDFKTKILISGNRDDYMDTEVSSRVRKHIRNQCCASGMFIPDTGSEFFQSRIKGQIDSGSRIRIRIKEFQYFNPKNCS